MALVSLIAGISDEVADIIVTEVGADSFLFDRVGLVTSEEELERRRGNPRISLDDQAAVRRVLSESVFLSLAGGALGTALGAAAAAVLKRLTPVPAVVHPWSVLLALSVTAAVGLFFGLYPAARAAALDPIDALGRSG